MRTKSSRKGCRQSSAMPSGLLPVINGVLTAAAATVMVILIMAVLLRYCIISQSVIPVANQVIKILGISLAAFIASRRPCRRPWARGLLAGVLYIIAGILVFSAIAGCFEFNVSNIADAAMGAIIGAVIALIFGQKE